MKKMLVITALLVFLSLLSSQELTPKEIINKIDQTEKVSSSHSTGKQIIETSGGKIRTLEFEAYSRDENDKQLTIYTGPKRVKGDKILMLNDGDDIWFYTPKTDRVRHLSSHAKKQKVQGSDFSYEDMSGGNIEEDYNYRLLGEEKIDGILCYKFELVPTETGPSYSKLILWADKEKYLSIQIDYFEDDDILKRLNSYDIEFIDNHWIAKKMIMKNLQDGGQTIMETTTIKFDTNPDEKLFKSRNLGN